MEENEKKDLVTTENNTSQNDEVIDEKNINNSIETKESNDNTSVNCDDHIANNSTNETTETIVTNNEAQAKEEQIELLSPETEEKIDKGAVSGVYNPAASEINRTYQKAVFFETLNGSIQIDENSKINKDEKSVNSVNTTDDYIAVLEKNREIFFKNYKKSSLMGNILGGLSFAFIVVAIIIAMTLSNNEKLTWLVYTMIGVTIVCCIVSMVIISLTRKKLNQKFQEYLEAYARTIASAAYLGVEGVTDAKISIGSKVIDKDVFASHYYNTIMNINSRHRIECNYLNRKLSDCEISVLVPNEITKKPIKEDIEILTQDQPTTSNEEAIDNNNANENDVKKSNSESSKREEDSVKTNNSGPITALYGKFISYDLALNNKEGIIIVISSNSTYFPTNLKNFEEYDIEGLNDNIYVYATDETFANDLLRQEVKDVLNSIQVDNIMTDAFISMNSAGTKIGINYCDDVVVVPVEKFPSREIVEHYPADVKKFLHLLKVIQDN